MRFERSRFGFDDLFTLVPATRDAPRAPFLDLRFVPGLDARHRHLVRGPGLYGIFFRRDDAAAHELVYVGKFRGRRTDPSGGNAVGTRWWAHAASLTMRGHRVSINPRTLGALPHVLPAGHAYLSLATAPAISKDRGCQAGLNRVLFAAAHVAPFAQLERCASTRARFRFGYVRVSGHGLGVAAIRDLIGAAETDLVARLRPQCNDATPRGGHLPGIGEDVFFAEAETVLAAAHLRTLGGPGLPAAARSAAHPG